MKISAERNESVWQPENRRYMSIEMEEGEEGISAEMAWGRRKRRAMAIMSMKMKESLSEENMYNIKG